MKTTKVINGIGKPLILRESTGSVKRTLKELKDKDSRYTISVDANATYREYWCAEKPDDPNAVVLSSDDCQEFKEVTILLEKKTVADGKTSDIYYWEGLKRDTGKKFTVKDGVQNEVVDSNGKNVQTVGDGVKTLVQRISEYFRGGSSNEKDGKEDKKTGNSQLPR
jgi:hypothetical protein